MQIEDHISVGDILILIGFVGTILGNYFMLKALVREVNYKVEELRRGRGLILEHWPPSVQRCFGYMNGGSHYIVDGK